MSFDVLIDFVTGKLYPALLVLFFFALTIFIHELGHFLAALREGMKIERFSIGFGPKIFSWRRKGVEYRLAWLPFGGYVALPQMAPMEAIEGKSEGGDVVPPAAPASKIRVAFAGPIMNIALAFVLASVLWVVGAPANVPVIGWVEPGSQEELKGLKPGDRIVAINDEKVDSWDRVVEAIAFNREPTVKLTVLRDGQRLQFDLEPQINEKFHVKMLDLLPRGHPYALSVFPDSPAAEAGLRRGDQFLAVEDVPIVSSDHLRELVGKRAGMATRVKILRDGQEIMLTVTPREDPKEKAGRMGVQLANKLDVMRPGPTPVAQIKEVFGSMARLVSALFHSRETGISVNNLQGPVAILPGWWYRIVTEGIRGGLVVAVLLNINLAVINLLPIPVLDGGHIVFAIIEAVRRRPLNTRVMQAMSTAFAVLLITFMLYISVLNFQQWFMPSRSRPSPTENAK